MENKQNCPVCGTLCTIEGHTTHYYKPINPAVDVCKCVYDSECHGIEMIKSPSGKEFAVGGTHNKDRFKFCPWCGGIIENYLNQKEPTND